MAPTFSPSGNTNGNDGAALSGSDKVTIALTIGVALPGTLAGVAGAYFGYAILKRKRKGASIVEALKTDPQS